MADTKKGGVKFIRKNGKVIPIRSGGSSGSKKGQARRKAVRRPKHTGLKTGRGSNIRQSAGMGFASGMLTGGALGSKGVVAGLGLGLYGTGRAIYLGAKAKKGQKLKTFGANWGAAFAGSLGGGFTAGIGRRAAGL